MPNRDSLLGKMAGTHRRALGGAGPPLLHRSRSGAKEGGDIITGSRLHTRQNGVVVEMVAIGSRSRE
jgi:hypothetical protein